MVEKPTSVDCWEESEKPGHIFEIIENLYGRRSGVVAVEQFKEGPFWLVVRRPSTLRRDALEANRRPRLTYRDS